VSGKTPATDSPITVHADHVRLTVRLTPNGGRAKVEGIEKDAAGTAYLKARVSEPPEKGKANAALVALIAKAFGVPKSRISILSGDTARLKTLRIDADPERLLDIMKSIASADGV
jgi:uncharacterized protein